MVGDLGLSETAYGLGASLFFIGYFIFEVPSNVIIERVGRPALVRPDHGLLGPRHLALGFTQNPTMFYILRFLLGACEAGFFPGVLYALTLWFPSGSPRPHGRSFMLVSAIANAIGAAIGGMLLDLDGLMGLKGWQWVFLATGGPGDHPCHRRPFHSAETGRRRAHWLDAEGKAWLRRTLARRSARCKNIDHANPFRVLLDRRVQLSRLLFVAFPLSAYGLSYWLPTVVKGFGVSNTTNGFHQHHSLARCRLRFVVEPAPRRPHRRADLVHRRSCPAWCHLSDLERACSRQCPQVRLLCASPRRASSPASRCCGPYRQVPHGATAAAGIAAINSVGNLGGFVAQNVVP